MTLTIYKSVSLELFVCGPHYGDVIMSALTSQITSFAIICATVYSGADQGKHQSSASLAFVRWIHCWPVNSPHKRPETGKMFLFVTSSWFAVVHRLKTRNIIPEIVIWKFGNKQINIFCAHIHWKNGAMLSHGTQKLPKRLSYFSY